MQPSPAKLLGHLYTSGSLATTGDGLSFALKNRLFDVSLVEVLRLEVDGAPLDLDQVLLTADGRELRAADVGRDTPLPFPLRATLDVRATAPPLHEGTHRIAVTVRTEPFGELSFEVEETLDPEEAVPPVAIPRAEANAAPVIVAERQRFVERFAGVQLAHLPHYSFDAALTEGNIENFTGVAQVPLGLAGSLRINGEHARGEFVIPLATSEGTLVASYNRGMKVLNASGGATCSVIDDVMQRAPVFVFDSAREARGFRDWVDEHLDEIRAAADATTKVGKLRYIDTFLAAKFAYLRFNFSTGDAAGQNMVGRATFAACSWILERVQGVRHFYLESNFATDKKASQVNAMRTRGKRVTAEVVVPAGVFRRVLRVEPANLHEHAQVANVGAFLSGANNNGLHSANGITAMFIATGQDVANVAESSAGVLYTELTGDGDLYVSITIPSLIVATVGGGTALATQRECLEILGCHGQGRASKLAEIVAGVVLAGEVSLAAAISSLDWVSSHEQYGRNRDDQETPP